MANKTRPVHARSSLGAYRLGSFSGIIPAALTANSEIFQFRWNPTTTSNLCVIRRVAISASVTTTFFAAGVPVQLDMVKSTAWTAAGTGGTAIAPAATIKRRTSLFGSSLVASGDIRIATTAALGAGTKTLEGNALGAVAVGGPITASLNGQFLTSFPLFEALVTEGDYPLILEAAEGFSIRAVAVPATGTWQVSVNVDWTEEGSY